MKEEEFMLSIDNRDKYPIVSIKKAKLRFVISIGGTVKHYIKIKTSDSFFARWHTYVMCLWPEEIYQIWGDIKKKY